MPPHNINICQQARKLMPGPIQIRKIEKNETVKIVRKRTYYSAAQYRGVLFVLFFQVHSFKSAGLLTEENSTFTTQHSSAHDCGTILRSAFLSAYFDGGRRPIQKGLMPGDTLRGERSASVLRYKLLLRAFSLNLAFFLWRHARAKTFATSPVLEKARFGKPLYRDREGSRQFDVTKFLQCITSLRNTHVHIIYVQGIENQRRSTLVRNT